MVIVETGFHDVGQVGLKVLTSGDLPTSASQDVGITGMSHPSWPPFSFLFFFFLSFLFFVFLTEGGFCCVAQAGVQ